MQGSRFAGRVGNHVQEQLGSLFPGVANRGAGAGENRHFSAVGQERQGIVMGDDGHVPACLQSALADSAGDTDRRYHGRNQEGGRRIVAFQHLHRIVAAVGFGHVRAAHQGRVRCQAPCCQRFLEAAPAPVGEVHMFQTVQQCDPGVAEVQQQVRRSIEGPPVVHVDPRCFFLGARDASVNDEGQIEFFQKPVPALVICGAVNDHAVGLLA